MGQLFSSPPEEPNNESVINISDSLLYRLTKDEDDQKKAQLQGVNYEHSDSDGDNPQGPKRDGQQAKSILDELPRDVEEKRQMEELKVMDEVHSLTLGLTAKNFEELLKKVEEQIDPADEKMCPNNEIITCLKKNQNCMINCMAAMNRFINCTDSYRINIIKQLIECEEKEKRKEDQENVSEFLNLK